MQAQRQASKQMEPAHIEASVVPKAIFPRDIGVFWNGGYAQMNRLLHGKSYSRKDDDWGQPILGNLHMINDTKKSMDTRKMDGDVSIW